MKQKKEVWTIELGCLDDDSDDGYVDTPMEACKDYYSYDEALAAA